EGVVHLTFGIEPSASSLAVTRAREHRAESVSVQRLLTPRRVAVVGAGRDPSSVGHTLVRHLVEGGFTGTVAPVNRAATEVAGLPAAATLSDVEEADLVVIAIPASGVLDVVQEAAEVGAHGLVVVSAGFAETGPDGVDRQRELVRRARANGMRVIGPNALGVINTQPDVSLNASLSSVMPGRGTIGFFSQSGAMGAALLESLVKRGLGLTTFVSAGNRADVSGNDLMQYWEEDDDTDVVLLYLESIGNPRKFSRIARRMGRRKPVVAVKTGRSSQGVPLGHSVRSTSLSQVAVDAMFEQAGVIRTDTLAQMFDVAQVLAFQPLPHGPRVLAMGNSGAMAVMAADAIEANGMELAERPLLFGPDAKEADFERALAAAVDDPAVDSIVTLFVPPLNASGESVARTLARVAGRATKPIVAVMFAVEGVNDILRRISDDGVTEMGSVPVFGAVEDAVRALGAVTHYATWRRRPVGAPVELDDVDVAAAERLVEDWLRSCAPADFVELGDTQAAELMSCYGIEVWPSELAVSAPEAVAAADRLGYPVVMKT
ncbi:MAG: CoA-binding protein, partial [Actinomycetes bacterium]